VPRAILFEPDRRNRVHLGANLLINGLEAREETIGLMAGAGFRLAQDFGPNLVFRKD
jgi:hypothetical protein